MTQERRTNLILIMGYNGSGKSTLVQKFIDEELKKKSRALIVTPDDCEFLQYELKQKIDTKANIQRHIFCSSTFEQLKNFRNGLIVFDDCRSYLKAQTDEDIHNLLIRRRQYMIDIIVVGHGFTEIPPKFFTFASHIILFNTVDNVAARKQVLKDYEEIKQLQAKVNEKAKTNPHYFKIKKY